MLLEGGLLPRYREKPGPSDNDMRKMPIKMVPCNL